MENKIGQLNMGKRKNGNAKNRSEYICLKCLQMKGCVCTGLQRTWGWRENNHEKTQWCVFCKEDVRALEVRQCDDLTEKREMARKLHEKYYGGDNYAGIGSKRCRV